MVCDYPSVQREIKAYEALSKAAETTTMLGQHCVRKALDIFEIGIGNRNYHFLIHEPLGFTIQMVANMYTYKGNRPNLPASYIRRVARHTLYALEFLHSAGVVHGDIQANNILLRIGDDSVLKDTEEDEIEHASRRKVTEQTTVFESRAFVGPVGRLLSSRDPFVLCDFGEARTGKNSYTEFIQPAPFRAPEIFLGIPWGTPVDIWNLGCMVWNLMFRNHPFFGRSSSGEDLEGQSSCRNRLARMAALLGPPPQELLSQSRSVAPEFFFEDGTPRGEILHETLESFLALSIQKTGRKMTSEDSEMFLAFLRKTLTWTQESRASASELLSDPWIQKTANED
ncbi:hypothetical protein C0992_012606 [Termitomyces sp. T32_za158]|nr:hypothetical protein C0992_012606 [Termitomyces sp. T32_za158]